MEWLIPVECFQKKGITFQGIPFLPILPEFPEISVPFVLELTYMYARLLTVILPRKNA